MVRDSITVRNTERDQLLRFLPEVIDDYRSHESDEMQDRADVLDDALATFETEQRQYELDEDTWDTVVGGLESLDNSKAAWLRTKIARRAELPVLRMGFTTAVPVGFMLTEEPPRRSGQ